MEGYEPSWGHVGPEMGLRERPGNHSLCSVCSGIPDNPQTRERRGRDGGSPMVPLPHTRRLGEAARGPGAGIAPRGPGGNHAAPGSREGTANLRTPWNQKAARAWASQHPGSPPRRARAPLPRGRRPRERGAGHPPVPCSTRAETAPAPAAAKERTPPNPPLSEACKGGKGPETQAAGSALGGPRGLGLRAAPPPAPRVPPLGSWNPVPAARAGRRGKQLAKRVRDLFQKPLGKFFLLENSLGRTDPDSKNGNGSQTSWEDLLRPLVGPREACQVLADRSPA